MCLHDHLRTKYSGKSCHTPRAEQPALIDWDLQHGFYLNYPVHWIGLDSRALLLSLSPAEWEKKTNSKRSCVAGRCMQCSEISGWVTTADRLIKHEWLQLPAVNLLLQESGQNAQECNARSITNMFASDPHFLSLDSSVTSSFISYSLLFLLLSPRTIPMCQQYIMRILWMPVLFPSRCGGTLKR
jgi:hypothetical protein